MIKILAKIKLYKTERKTPFKSGYRPLFNFIPDMKTSGQITLKENTDFCPGEEGIVEIAFLHREFLGEKFDVGSKFTFGEGALPFGEGEVREIISN
ncbi:hypothetical protein [Pedobacter sp. AJM]|uniref:hypothetical protein n=1 Tax=Pedobacter sp. AJM TaxID=2003629 RepID=UPI000B4BD679|nr:hypothetical protein [Pedobacter sp. AJM]OWK68865.1 hypothetical protein CBW18_19840 [Pedobacter sp. AJM]